MFFKDLFFFASEDTEMLILSDTLFCCLFTHARTHTQTHTLTHTHTNTYTHTHTHTKSFGNILF